MNTSAGISIRISGSRLVVFQGKDPEVAAQSAGITKPEPPVLDPPKPRGGFGGLLRRFVGKNTEVEINWNDLLADQAPELFTGLLKASDAAVPRRVVIAVSAYAHDEHRQKIMDAAKMAGWDPLGLVNEPTAAGLASGVLKSGDGNVLVYDLGEERFDVSLGRFQGVEFEVLATSGLSSVDRTGTLPLSEVLERTVAPFQDVLRDVGMKAGDVDSVVLVGELCLNPKTAEFVTELVGTVPQSRFDPEDIVAIGAAIKARLIDANAG